MKTTVFRLMGFGSAASGVLGLLIWIGSALADSESALPAPEVSKIVELRGVTVQGDVVSGEIVNLSSRQLRDVQLLIRRCWHWKNEFRPGENSPGSADYYTVEREIPPGTIQRFAYRFPAPSPSRPDGQFETAVTVAGFNEIVHDQERQIRERDRRPVS
jgi:hypothetical protein